MQQLAHLVCPYTYLFRTLATWMPRPKGDEVMGLNAIHDGVGEFWAQQKGRNVNEPMRQFIWCPYDYVRTLESMLRYAILDSDLPALAKADLASANSNIQTLVHAHYAIPTMPEDNGVYLSRLVHIQSNIALAVLRLYFHVNAVQFLRELYNGKTCVYYTDLLMFLGALNINGTWLKSTKSSDTAFYRVPWSVGGCELKLVDIGVCGNVVGRDANDNLEELLTVDLTTLGAKIIKNGRYTRVEYGNLEVICPANRDNNNGHYLQALSMFRLLHELHVHEYEIPNSYIFRGD